MTDKVRYPSVMMDAMAELMEKWSPPSWILVTVAVGLAMYLYYKHKYSYFSERSIPGPLPIPLFGTTYNLFIKGLMKHDLDARAQYGKLAGLYESGRRVLLVSDEAIMREVMVKKFNDFTNRRIMGGIRQDELLSNMLTTLEDGHWKRVRSLLTPTFSTGNIKMMNKIIHECGVLLLHNLDQLAGNEEGFEMKEYCSAYAMDVVARTGFGIAVNSQQDQDNEYVKYAKKAFDLKITGPTVNLALVFRKLTPYLSMTDTISLVTPQVKEFFTNMVEQAMANRKNDSQNYRDLLQLLLNAHGDYNTAEVAKKGAKNGIGFEQNQPTEKGLTKMEVLAQGLLFILAGYESTANVLSILLYSLACHQDCQRKVQQEIEEKLADKEDVTYSDIQSLVYLDQCLQETLRLYPPAPRVDRVASRDTRVGEIHLSKDTVVAISILAVHMDPDIWPEPKKFDPDRFSPAERTKHSPFDHMPFGYGPRNCIAMRLALMEIKVAAVLVLRKLNILTCDRTQIPITFQRRFSSQAIAVNGIWLKAERR